MSTLKFSVLLNSSTTSFTDSRDKPSLLSVHILKVIVRFKPLRCQDDCVSETTEQNVHHILDLGTNCQDDELTATPSTVEEIGTNVGIVFLLF